MPVYRYLRVFICFPGCISFNACFSFFFVTFLLPVQNKAVYLQI